MNNQELCDYDYGDCCGAFKQIHFCMKCECISKLIFRYNVLPTSFILFSKYQSSPAMLTVTATGVIVKMENVCASWTIITDWTAPYPDVSKGNSFSKVI